MIFRFTLPSLVPSYRYLHVQDYGNGTCKHLSPYIVQLLSLSPTVLQTLCPSILVHFPMVSLHPWRALCIVVNEDGMDESSHPCHQACCKFPIPLFLLVLA